LWAPTRHNIPKPKHAHRADCANPTVAWRSEAVLPCQSAKPTIVEAGNFATPMRAEYELGYCERIDCELFGGKDLHAMLQSQKCNSTPNSIFGVTFQELKKQGKARKTMTM
jgi:hypothetical protein